jgi:hypothetical protein
MEDAPAGLELGANGVGDIDGDARTPDLLQVLGEQRSPPPVLRRAQARGGQRLDPVARPPEPPQRKNSKPKSKSKAGRQ